MSNEQLIKINTYILKVNIHCNGCKKDVKKALKTIMGVNTVEVDSEQNKVTVKTFGTVDPQIFIKNLKKIEKLAKILEVPTNNQKVDDGRGGGESSKNQGPSGGGGRDGKKPEGGSEIETDEDE